MHKVIRDRALYSNQPLPLVDHLVQLVGDKKEVKILDVGSGPFPITGQELDGVDVEVRWCDQRDFTDFWKELGQEIDEQVEPLFLIERENMEDLSYSIDYFDIVHCVNALDHTKDARAALEEMLRVVKPGGWVYIDCALDQLTAQGKKHYWDAKEDGTLTNSGQHIDLKGYGFKIKFVDNHLGERQYNHMIARKHA